MDADAEMPFLGPPAGDVQFGFVVCLVLQRALQIGLPDVALGPCVKERAADHRVENAGVLAQVFCQRRRCADDVDQQIDQLRICLEQRKQLHARRQPRQKPVKRAQCLVRSGGA